MFNFISRFRSVFIGMAILAFLMAMPLDQAVAALVETESFKGELSADTIRTRLMTLLAKRRSGLLSFSTESTRRKPRHGSWL